MWYHVKLDYNIIFAVTTSTSKTKISWSPNSADITWKFTRLIQPYHTTIKVKVYACDKHQLTLEHTYLINDIRLYRHVFKVS